MQRIMKKKPLDFIKPHLKGLSLEERHAMLQGFLLGLEYTKQEMDNFIKQKEQQLS